MFKDMELSKDIMMQFKQVILILSYGPGWFHVIPFDTLNCVHIHVHNSLEATECTDREILFLLLLTNVLNSRVPTRTFSVPVPFFVAMPTH